MNRELIRQNWQSKYYILSVYRANSKCDMHLVGVKFAIVFCFTFFQEESYNTFKCLVLLILSFCIYISFLKIRPYYSDSITKVIYKLIKYK